ncbi:MAG: hypothetical protein R3268_14445 [Acidiferrobacterales bacterium]|nr:hypothetical protein [Acidiferrobacterales bacterium]
MDLPPDISTRWISDNPSAMAQRVAVLSPEERTRLGTFKHAGRRLGFTMGRFAARTLAGENLGMRPEEVPLVVGDPKAAEVDGAPRSGDRIGVCRSRGVPIAKEAVHQNARSLAARGWSEQRGK